MQQAEAQPPPAPAQVSLCARVADHLVSLMSGAGKHPPEATDPLRRVIGNRCDEDRWTDATKQCLLQLASLADGERCQAMMTPAQVEAFQRDSEAAFRGTTHVSHSTVMSNRCSPPT